MFDVPQSSTLSTWYSGIISAPLNLGKFVLDGLTPVNITERTGVLYRVTHAMFDYNCDNNSLASGIVKTNPAAIQLSITANKGELLLANKFILGGNHPFPVTSWRKTKNDNEPLFVVPMGEVDASNPIFLGITELQIVCRFQVESISDKDFAANFSKGCI